MVAKVGVDGPTPRIQAQLDNNTTITILPDSGSCVNLVDENALNRWGLSYKQEDREAYHIYDVQGNRIPIIGTLEIRVKIENTPRYIQALEIGRAHV